MATLGYFSKENDINIYIKRGKKFLRHMRLSPEVEKFVLDCYTMAELNSPVEFIVQTQKSFSTKFYGLAYAIFGYRIFIYAGKIARFSDQQWKAYTGRTTNLEIMWVIAHEFGHLSHYQIEPKSWYDSYWTKNECEQYAEDFAAQAFHMLNPENVFIVVKISEDNTSSKEPKSYLKTTRLDKGFYYIYIVRKGGFFLKNKNGQWFVYITGKKDSLAQFATKKECLNYLENI